MVSSHEADLVAALQLLRSPESPRRRDHDQGHVCRGQDIQAHSLRVAVYTANIGGYDPVRTTDISCVPHNIDAFYFLDESGIQRNAAALKIWEKRGWKVMSYDMIPGTEGVDSARLTGKELKFAPPKWLASGYDWLVFHDSIRYIDLSNLTSFLVERQSHALVLLDYCRVLSKCCGRDGWFCMNLQVSHYSRKSNFDKVAATFNKTKMWFNEAMKHKRAGLLMPHYFHTCIMFRNLRHKHAHDVTLAFNQTFNACHEMQRDQPILPFFLSMQGLQDEIEAAQASLLEDKLDFDLVSEHQLPY